MLRLSVALLAAGAATRCGADPRATRRSVPVEASGDPAAGRDVVPCDELDADPRMSPTDAAWRAWWRAEPLTARACAQQALSPAGASLSSRKTKTRAGAEGGAMWSLLGAATAAVAEGGVAADADAAAAEEQADAAAAADAAFARALALDGPVTRAVFLRASPGGCGGVGRISACRGSSSDTR